MLFISGETPAIEVSGMFVLRGGGGGESREWGRYSVAVESFRLAACWNRQRRHIGEGLDVDDRTAVLEEMAANLKRLDEGEVKGIAARYSDILRIWEGLDNYRRKISAMNDRNTGLVRMIARCIKNW